MARLASFSPQSAKLRVALLAASAAACLAVQADSLFAPSATQADQVWRLPAPPMPADNMTTPSRVELGRALFFDPRLAGSGAMSCATCHNPSLGWSDGLKTAIGANGKVLGRATPTITNTAYNTQFMWDGRKKSLEDQALGPMQSRDEMASDMHGMSQRLASVQGYAAMFAAAYPGQPISSDTIAKAIAAFERTIVVRNTAFDRWLDGDAQALNQQQWRGYKVFNDPVKGNCVACHSAPNFTDNGYHNVGLNPAGNGDMGRYAIRQVASLKGAFKTPSLRDIAATAPYFHDGRMADLAQVVDYYERIGVHRTEGLSPSIRPLQLTVQDKQDLVMFLQALSSPSQSYAVPSLPQ